MAANDGHRTHRGTRIQTSATDCASPIPGPWGPTNRFQGGHVDECVAFVITAS
jgi:hypothetical protein